MIIFWKKWDKEQVLELSLHEACLWGSNDLLMPALCVLIDGMLYDVDVC